MYDEIINNLIDKISLLPGIGPKSAARIAFFLLDVDKGFVDDLILAIDEAKSQVKFCEQCGNTSIDVICQICANNNRDCSIICVVEEPRDIVAIEKTREYRGKYLVLGGALNPIQNITPDNLRLDLLMKRIANPEIKEVILATNPNVEGEVTASYIARMLAPFKLKVTKIATGLPMGGDLEYADQVTLGKAIESRREFE